MIKKLGSDKMDEYSKPIKSEKTPLGLGVLYTFKVRALPEKPGRTVVVLDDNRVSFIPDFTGVYYYVNILWQKGNSAGNHYHNRKQEVFTSLSGTIEVNLQSVDEPNIRETVILNAAKENDSEVKKLFIPTHIAHAITAQSDTVMLHVSANYPNNDEDEFSYIVTK